MRDTIKSYDKNVPFRETTPPLPARVVAQKLQSLLVLPDAHMPDLAAGKPRALQLQGGNPNSKIPQGLRVDSD